MLAFCLSRGQMALHSRLGVGFVSGSFTVVSRAPGRRFLERIFGIDHNADGAQEKGEDAQVGEELTQKLDNGVDAQDVLPQHVAGLRGGFQLDDVLVAESKASR